jgi:D-inositol-3-phosphate glycosyltransferase
MACETPVVATEVGGNPYLIVEGKSGFLVPPNDPLSLAQKIKFVLENPNLAKHVTKTAASEIKAYDKDKIGGLLKTVIKNLINA